jgi:hypothetical protein
MKSEKFVLVDPFLQKGKRKSGVLVEMLISFGENILVHSFRGFSLCLTGPLPWA